jgi:hypothetical protein
MLGLVCGHRHVSQPLDYLFADYSEVAHPFFSGGT